MPTCHACGAPLDHDARFCSQCGAPAQASPRVEEPTPEASTPARDETAAFDAPADAAGGAGRLGQVSGRTWAVLGHLSGLVPPMVGVPLTFLGPLVMFLLLRDDELARDQAAEALNFNLSVLLYSVVLLVIGAALAIPTLLIGLVPVGLLGIGLLVAWLVLVVVAAVRASNGERYRYPLTIRFVQP